MTTPGAAPGSSILADRYLLGPVLSSGGTGTVYRATDLRTGGPVAVKLPHPTLVGDPVHRERLRREALLAASLTSPRVVRVLDLGEHNGTPFLVLEYVRGAGPSARPWRSPWRWPGPGKRPTPWASSTATSSPRTSSSPRGR